MADRLEIYENTRVLRVEEGLIETERARVQANSVVFACHYPFVNVPGFYFARMHQERSYVLALEHAAALQGMYYGIDRTGTPSDPWGGISCWRREPPCGRKRRGRRIPEELRAAAGVFSPA